MIIDKLLRMSWAQALTTSAPSTDVIDLGVARDLGVGNDAPTINVVVDVGTAFASTGASTLTIALQGSTDNASFTVMEQSPAIAKASLTAGARLVRWSLPGRVAGQSMPRYIRMNYTVATADFTNGTLNAFLTLDRQDNSAYPAGITISN